ncbi:MAG: WecB/TagA/CpsF family glycosyltransferase [Pseudomonadota bacterium]
MDWNLRTDDARPITVTALNRGTLLSELEEAMRQGRGFSVATLNLDHVVKLRLHPDFLEAYAAHTHVTADGNPIVWLSHLAGQADVELIPGSELVAPVVAAAARVGASVALVGGTEASLAEAATALEQQYEHLRIVLCHAPPMGFDPTGSEADRAIAALAESGAQVVFLALGAPRQEQFAAYAQGQLPQCGFLSVGAGLDFIAGTQKRAPVWVRRLSAEWLWRMLRDPGRLAARYAACFAILPRLTGRAAAIRRAR